jgi:hypothetical protein
MFAVFVCGTIAAHLPFRPALPEPDGNVMAVEEPDLAVSSLVSLLVPSTEPSCKVHAGVDGSHVGINCRLCVRGRGNDIRRRA